WRGLAASHRMREDETLAEVAARFTRAFIRPGQFLVIDIRPERFPFLPEPVVDKSRCIEFRDPGMHIIAIIRSRMKLTVPRVEAIHPRRFHSAHQYC